MTKRAHKRDAGVQSVDIGLKLMSILAHQRKPMKITDLAARADMPPAKAHRYLVSFVRAGFAAQDEDSGLYTIGPLALEFSLSCLSTIEPIAIATREAEQLCRETGHTVAIAVWGSFGPTVVRWEQPPRPLMVNFGLGSVFPLLQSATGRVFAAFFDESALAEQLRHESAAQKRSASESVDDVRRRGVARAKGDFMEGMSAFAAPVFDYRKRMVLCMTVLGYSGGFDHRWNGAVAAALRASAARVSRSLGHEG